MQDVSGDQEVTNNGPGSGELSVPLLGPIRHSPRGDWRTEVMLEGCDHKKAVRRSYGPTDCPDCLATKGVDGLWRRIVPA